jgi:hypothetical protein
MLGKKLLLLLLVLTLAGAGCAQKNGADDATFLDGIFGNAKQGLRSGSQKAGTIINNAGNNFVKNLTQEQKKIVDEWLAKNKLNQYGDALGTLYTGGTPLFDESTSESKNRFEHLFKKFPELRNIIRDEEKLKASEIEK